ncbi:hypothetical protein OY671_009349, partial [Metschnikowia pulcherrima]
MLSVFEETARWSDRNTAITAAGSSSADGHPRRSFGEAGSMRAVGDSIGDDGGVLSRSPLGQIEVIESSYHRPEFHEGKRSQQRQLDEPHLRCSGQHGTFDASAAAVLSVRQSDHIGSPESREWASACYGQLQPQVAVLPEVEPFFAESYSAIDKACPHWVFAAPNQRSSMTMFWQAMPWYQR